ncbi:hypothetical protein ADL26_13735, partial [Thermoactinomyces vulgaris]
EHDVAGVAGDLDGAFGVGPLHVAARRAVDLVPLVGAGDDLGVAAALFGQVGEEVGELDGQARARVGLGLAILAAAVLVPFEPEGALALDRRVLVHVRVVDVEVPAQDRPHVVEGLGVVEEEREFRAGSDGVEAV